MREKKYLRFVLASLALFGSMVCTTALPSSKESQADPQVYREETGGVVSYGFGSDKHLAKVDAVRNALNFAVEQIVVVERRIEGDNIVKDMFISSMSGQLGKVEILNFRELDDGEVSAKIRIFLSDGEIKKTYKQFTTAFASPDITKTDLSDIATQLLTSETEFIRKQTQLSVASKILHGAADGYLYALKARVSEVIPNAKNSTVQINVEYWLDDDWLDSFRRSIKTASSLVADMSFPVSEKVYLKSDRWRGNAKVVLSEICFQGEKKGGRQVFTRKRPPRYNGRGGGECFRVPVYSGFAGNGNNGQPPGFFRDKPYWREEPNYGPGSDWRTGSLTKGYGYLRFAGIARVYKASSIKNNKRGLQPLWQEHFTRTSARPFAVVYGFSKDGMLATCHLADIYTPITHQKGQKYSSLLPSWENLKYTDQQLAEAHQYARFIVPHAGDRFIRRRTLSYKSLVNKDRTNTVSVFAVKVVEAEGYGDTRERYRTLVYDSLGDRHTYTSPIPEALNDYCAETKESVARELGI